MFHIVIPHVRLVQKTPRLAGSVYCRVADGGTMVRYGVSDYCVSFVDKRSASELAGSQSMMRRKGYSEYQQLARYICKTRSQIRGGTDCGERIA